MRHKCLVVSAVAFGLLVLLPASVLAQSAIAGVVRDTSGAVLPGVVVEASSPVLIEKMRSVVTDGATNLDLYNLLNSVGIATVNPTYGPAWLRPTLVQLARYVKIGVQIDF